ncbi:MAG: transporter substrate-binding domain-containing protein [Pseudomonadota bacterium]
MLFTRFVAVFVAVMGAASAGSAMEVTIATGEYAPFSSEELDGFGSVNERLSDYADTAGLELIFEFMPWMRALESTRRGHFVATSYWYFSEDRQADFIHVGPLVQDRLVLFGRSDTVIVAPGDLTSLGDLTVGIVPGYTYTTEFWELVESGALKVSEGPNDMANLRKLLAGRIDLVPLSEEAGWHMIKESFDADQVATFSVLGKPLSTTQGFLLVSRATDGAEEIAARLQAVIDGAEKQASATPVEHAD